MIDKRVWFPPITLSGTLCCLAVHTALPICKPKSGCTVHGNNVMVGAASFEGAHQVELTPNAHLLQGLGHNRPDFPQIALCKQLQLSAYNGPYAHVDLACVQQCSNAGVWAASPLYLGNRMAKELSSRRPVGLSSLENLCTSQWFIPSWSHGFSLSCLPCRGQLSEHLHASLLSGAIILHSWVHNSLVSTCTMNLLSMGTTWTAAGVR